MLRGTLIILYKCRFNSGIIRKCLFAMEMWGWKNKGYTPGRFEPEAIIIIIIILY